MSLAGALLLAWTLGPPDPGAEPPPVMLADAQPPRQGGVWDPGTEPVPPTQNPDAEPPPEPAPTDATNAVIPGRRRPGVPQHQLPGEVQQTNPGAIRSPPPDAYPTNEIPVPDRWRLIQTLCPTRSTLFPAIGEVCHSPLDPYHQNVLKGDIPICIPTDEEQQRRREAGIPRCRTPRFLGLRGNDWFFVASAVSDTVIEPRTFPIPVGVQTTDRPGSLDVFGRDTSLVVAQTFIASFALIKGDTAYRPPNIEYRLTLAFQGNYVDVPERRILFVQPSRGTHRYDTSVGVQEAFVDYHLRNVSDRYDFDSIRVGIQPLQFDFRGFLFNDDNLAVRLFGNRDDNRWQYNLIGVWRIEKDTNTGLNDVWHAIRRDWILHANVFRQDFPLVGLTSELSATWNINREGDETQLDDNGFPVRPELIGDLRGHDYEAYYLGYNADGRIGRINLTGSFYYLFGRDS